MIGPLSRIALRYIAGALVAYGLINEEQATMIAFDPDYAMLIGAAMAAVVEGVYAVAKRFGWSL